ncbi:MAG TPA: HAD-IA family hydrolase [Nitrososphaeraceae archaeon]|nr:HAD-IA family hydrolase [Nitrososphaeraceae archaeon]
MYKSIGKRVFINRKLKSFNVDCALFDIDGVIVDVRKSYDLAIKKTVDFIVKHITGTSIFDGLVTEEMILKFRRTGGFNNDVDTSYAIIISALADYYHGNVNQLRKFIHNVATKANASGIISVERFLSSSPSLEKLKELLAYPGPVGQSIVATVFDELFYGPELFKKKHRLEPKYYFGKPLIENDILVATRTAINALSEIFNGNIAIVSGRSKLAAEHSLKPIFDIFNQHVSIYLEDENRKYSKPNPYAIKKAMSNMNAKTAIYVGDSAEDILMTRRIEEETGVKITFFGIYGCSTKPADTIKLFKENGADAIIETVNQLPNILNKALIKL